MNITQFEQYVNGCLITWNHGDFYHELVNQTLGLTGEFIEFHQTLLHDGREKQVDEAGDLLYYSTVLLYNIINHDLDRLSVENDIVTIQRTALFMQEAYLYPDLYPFMISSFNQHDKFYAILKNIGIISEHTKKVVFHGRDFNYDLAMDSALHILMWLYYILAEHNIEVSEVMTYNFEKLSKRYPDGFKRLAEQTN